MILLMGIFSSLISCAVAVVLVGGAGAEAPVEKKNCEMGTRRRRPSSSPNEEEGKEEEEEEEARMARRPQPAARAPDTSAGINILADTRIHKFCL